MHSHRLSSSSLSVSPPPSPQAPASVINKSNRADQIVQSIYGKAAQIILQSRVTHIPSPKDKIQQDYFPSTLPSYKKNRWFNLETDEIEEFRTETKYWRNVCTSEDPVPPLIIEIYLDTTDLLPSQIVVVLDEFKHKHKIEINKNERIPYHTGINSRGTRKTILLESWKLALGGSKDCPYELPTIYKHGITFFRALYATIRLLPAHRLFHRLRKSKNTGLKIAYRLTVKDSKLDSEIGLNSHSVASEPILQYGTKSFDSISTPLGTFTMDLISRHNCNFYVEDGEKLLSSRFQDIDADLYSNPNIHGEIYRHRRSSSHGNYATSSSETVDQTSLIHHQSTKLNDYHTGSQTSSSASIESGFGIKGSHIAPSMASTNSLSRPTISREPSLRLRNSPQSYDSTSLSKIVAERNSNVYSGTKVSPPSHISMISRRSPSLNMFSPFKSPSLSSSPSFQNASPPSKPNSLSNRSSTSIDRGVQFTNRLTSSPSIRPISPAPSKLSSSFGHRFGSINENYINAESYQSHSPSSIGRRSHSNRIVNTINRSQESVVSHSTANLDMSTLHEALSTFLKELPEKITAPAKDSEVKPVQIGVIEFMIEESKQSLKKLEDISKNLEINDGTSELAHDNPSQEAPAPILHLAQYKMPEVSKPVPIPTNRKFSIPRINKPTYSSFTGAAPKTSSLGTGKDPTSYSFPEKFDPAPLPLSKQLTLHRNSIALSEAPSTLGETTSNPSSAHPDSPSEHMYT